MEVPEAEGDCAVTRLPAGPASQGSAVFLGCTDSQHLGPVRSDARARVSISVDGLPFKTYNFSRVPS